MSTVRSILGNEIFVGGTILYWHHSLSVPIRTRSGVHGGLHPEDPEAAHRNPLESTIHVLD